MKIAQVVGSYYPTIGGVETHVEEISNRLVKKGYNVSVICADPKKGLPRIEGINGVKVIRFKTFLTPQKKYYFAPGIYVYLKNNNFDLIHAHNYHSFPPLFAGLSREDNKFIFTPHYHAKKNLLHVCYKVIGAKVFEKAAKIICVSKYEMEQIRIRFKVPESKLVQIPNGINLEEFRGVKPVLKKGKTLLYVGRFEEYKGMRYAIIVLKELADYRLVLVGKGPCEKSLKKLAYDLKVYDRIDWFRDVPRDELISHYRSADVFLMLSKYESYGITVAEALASGTPCIVAKGSALEDFINGEGCIGLDYPIDVEALKDAILKFHKNGRIKDQAKLKTWDEVVESTLNVYESIC